MPPPVLEAEVAVVHVLVPVEGLARTRKRKRENKNGGDQRVRSAIREREEAALSREDSAAVFGRTGAIARIEVDVAPGR